MAARDETNRVAAVLVAVVLVNAIVFAPVASQGFIDFDDTEYITDNPVVLQGLTADGAYF